MCLVFFTRFEVEQGEKSSGLDPPITYSPPSCPCWTGSLGPTHPTWSSCWRIAGNRGCNITYLISLPKMSTLILPGDYVKNIEKTEWGKFWKQFNPSKTIKLTSKNY